MTNVMTNVLQDNAKSQTVTAHQRISPHLRPGLCSLKLTPVFSPREMTGH